MRVPPRRLRQRLTLAALPIGVALALAGCGGRELATPGTEEGAESPEADAVAEAKEFTIELSRTTFAPGTYVILVENTGSVDHALALSGPGVELLTPTLAPGESTGWTVYLETEGSYVLYCLVDGHRGKGMELVLQVGEAGPSTTPAPTSVGGGYGGY